MEFTIARVNSKLTRTGNKVNFLIQNFQSGNLAQEFNTTRVVASASVMTVNSNEN